MTSSIGESQKAAIGRLTGSVLAAALVVSGLVAASPALATTATNPTVVFDGNTLATTTPGDVVVPRLDVDSLALSPAPLSTVVSTTRAGYTFGGWSLERGGEASKEITTARTSDTFRIIYAVWNSTVRYNSNGADSGALTNFKTQDVYRFGQNLTLPTAGTLEKSRFQFAGWMSAPYSPTRITSYVAGNSDVGNPTLYAAWIRTASFDANGATGTVPASMVYTSSGPRLKLPSFTETTLRKPGYYLAGWSAFQTGPIITNPNSFVPLQAQTTLYAIWKVQGTSATSDIAFKPGKSVLRAGQKRVLDDVASSIGRGTDVKVTVASLRGPGTTKALGKARNRAVIKYLRSLGIEAAFARSNAVATSGTATTPRNNRVALQASWTNPAS
jgi:uncharacterized repeat protein (TIGR02543 family)